MSETLADLVVKLSADFGNVGPQLASLAGQFDAVGTSATKTGAIIDSELDSKLQALMDSGSTLAEAMAKVGTSIEDVAPSASSAAEAMTAFDESIEPFSTNAELLRSFDDVLEPIPEDAFAGMDAMHGLAQSTQEEAEAAEEAKDKSMEFLKSLAEFAGIGLSLEAIKATLEEAVEAFAKTEKAQLAFSLLRGSAEAGEAAIESLKDMAQELAIPFEALVPAAQQMAAMGLATEQVDRALRTAANSAAVSGKEFSTVSSGLLRMSEGGMVSARFLTTLGLNMGQLAEVMHVKLGDVQKDFRSLSEGSRLEYLAEALDKFKGGAKAAAEATGGSITRLKNDWLFGMEEMGQAVAPVINALEKLNHYAEVGLAAVELELNAFATQAKAVYDILKGLADRNGAEVVAGMNEFKAAMKEMKQQLTDLAVVANLEAGANDDAAAAAKKKANAELAALGATKGHAEASKEAAKEMEEESKSLAKIADAAAFEAVNKQLYGVHDQLGAIYALAKQLQSVPITLFPTTGPGTDMLNQLPATFSAVDAGLKLMSGDISVLNPELEGLPLSHIDAVTMGLKMMQPQISSLTLFAGDFNKALAGAFGNIGSKILTTIAHAKNLGDAWKAVGKQIEDSLLKSVGNVLDDLLKKEISNLTAGVAADKAAASAKVAASAGQAAAGGFASVMEDVPFPLNVGLAPEVAAAAAAQALTFGVFAAGTDVPHDMVAMVHAGEGVLTEGQNSKMGQMIDKGAFDNLTSAGKSGDTHIHINGATKSLMDEVWNYGVKQGRRAGVNW